MRHALIPVLLTALALSCLPPAAGGASGQSSPAFDVAGTDAPRVTAFLKSLQSAVSLGNRTKVATLVLFPLKVWLDGEETTVRNESEFQARYSRIFDADVKRAIAEAKVDTLVASQQGVMLDNGRVWFRPLAEHKHAMKIFAINDPAQPR